MFHVNICLCSRNIQPTLINEIDTEIDWKAYVEEVSGVLVDGELNYVNLKGGTGNIFSTSKQYFQKHNLIIL